MHARHPNISVVSINRLQTTVSIVEIANSLHIPDTPTSRALIRQTIPFLFGKGKKNDASRNRKARLYSNFHRKRLSGHKNVLRQNNKLFNHRRIHEKVQRKKPPILLMTKPSLSITRKTSAMLPSYMRNEYPNRVGVIYFFSSFRY